MKQITPASLAAWLADPARSKPLLLDVREPWEYQTCRIEGSQLVPMLDEVERRSDGLRPEQHLVDGGYAVSIGI